jgi:hypothetical protein
LKVFDEFLIAIKGTGLAATTRFDLPLLLPQVVAGHRLWAAGSGASETERFVSIQRVEFVQDVAAKEIWLRIYLFADDVKRIGLGYHDLLDRSQIGTAFQQVHSSDILDSRPLICCEQTSGVSYGHRPSDKVQTLVDSVKEKLWCTVLSIPPYRKYYLYPAPISEQPQVLPQLLSVYAITFYLGSITRYRPHHFNTIINGEFGPQVEAFLNDHPQQFVYLMASQFAEQEVTKAALV